MAGRSGLVCNLLEFLEIHSPIRSGRHLDQVTEKTRHVKTGEAGLSHCTRLELRYFFAGPLVTILFGNPRAVGPFCFFERLFGQRWRKLIDFNSAWSVMKFRDDTDALGALGVVKVGV